MTKSRDKKYLLFTAIIIFLLCVSLGLLSACKSSESSSAPGETVDENTTSEVTDIDSTEEPSESTDTTDENTKSVIPKTREDYYSWESETMPGEDDDLLTEKQAMAILNARIAPDNDKMIREIDHKVIINGKPYFFAHAYTEGRDFRFTHGWYILDRKTGDLYKENFTAKDGRFDYVEKD